MEKSNNKWACQIYEYREEETKNKDTSRKIRRRLYLAIFASASIILYCLGLICLLDKNERFGPIGATINSSAKGLTGFGVTPITIAVLLITAGLLINQLVSYLKESTH